MTPSDIVFRLSKTQDAFVFSDAIVNLLYSSKGEGKCLDPSEEVIMYDGTLKQVKDIVVGDLLMGDDSTPRKVLELGSGTAEMFEVVPIKGEPFKCNGDHILVLNHPGRRWTKKNPRHVPESESEISVYDYMKSGKTFRGVYSRLFRAGLEFQEKEVPVDPYFLGVWLGDGDSHRSAVTTADNEILEVVQKIAAKYNLLVTKVQNSNPSNKSNGYHLSRGNIGGGLPHNGLYGELKNLNLLHNKHIPDIYKFNSREIRLKVLAGLVDTDGTVNHGGYDFVFVNERLAKDLVYLCRSLQLAAYLQPCKKSIKSSGFTGNYFRVHVSGDCSAVPTLVPRKKCLPRKQVKRVWITGIKEIRSLGVGPYKGFVLDGNHRFLLGSFIVSHNTFSSIAALIQHAKRCGTAIRGAIVRDSHENIKISTVNSIMDALPVGYYKFKNDYKHLDIFSDPPVAMDLFGIDDLSAVSKLQGPEYAVIWLEEPAPIADAANAGLSEDVYNAALASCARQRGTVPRLQISMNPGNEEHWTYRRFFTDPILSSEGDFMVDPANPLITIKVFRIPVGENKELSEIARQATRSAYSSDVQSFARYAKGEFAKVYTGKKVTPDYNKNGQHYSDSVLAPANGLVGFRAWDSWHSPSPYDEKTEILMSDGWRLIKDVNVGEIAITLNPNTLDVEYQPIRAKYIWEYQGDMYHWSGNYMDIRVAEEHSMAIYSRKAKNVYFKRAMDVTKTMELTPPPGNWVGVDAGKFIIKRYDNVNKHYDPIEIDMNCFCKFMGIYLSEGSSHAMKKKATDLHPSHYCTTIYQNNRDPKIEKVLNSLPFKWAWTVSKTWCGWKANSVQLHHYLSAFGKSHEKYVPQEIKNATVDQIKSFLEFYTLGDGSERSKTHHVITTSSKIMADDLQELSLKAGWRATITVSDNIGRAVNIRGEDNRHFTRHLTYRISINKLFVRSILSPKNLTISPVKNGMELVYCVEVPNHVVYVRRNGRATWCGNCVVGQITRTGRLVFLDTLRVLESDIRTLIKAQVMPLIHSPRWKDKCREWRDVGDCSMRQPDQSNKNESAARVVEEAFGTIFEPGPKLWEHLKNGMTRALNENINGLPAIVVSKQNRILHDALSGSWHYKTDKAGNLINNIPHKTASSHVGDAFANACSVLLPEIGVKMDKSKWNAISKRLKNRANSY